jgi:hypothetical protein
LGAEPDPDEAVEPPSLFGALPAADLRDFRPADELGEPRVVVVRAASVVERLSVVVRDSLRVLAAGSVVGADRAAGSGSGSPPQPATARARTVTASARNGRGQAPARKLTESRA